MLLSFDTPLTPDSGWSLGERVGLSVILACFIHASFIQCFSSGLFPFIAFIYSLHSFFCHSFIFQFIECLLCPGLGDAVMNMAPTDADGALGG